MPKYHTKREIVVRFNNVYEWEKIKKIISEDNLNVIGVRRVK